MQLIVKKNQRKVNRTQNTVRKIKDWETKCEGLIPIVDAVDMPLLAAIVFVIVLMKYVIRNL